MASTGMVIKQGYLYRKRERSTSKVLKKPWQYGYFVLMESPVIEGLLLEEYKDASLKMIKQSLVLGAIKHVGQVWTSKSKQYAFEIVTMGKLALMLACDNESLMNEWMRTFSNFMWTIRSSPEGSPGLLNARNDSDASGVSHDSGKHVMERHGKSSVRKTGTPKGQLFEVRVQRTPLSVTKKLDGSYQMQITKSRVVLKTLNGKAEVLSWPLDQMRGFKSQPELQQVFFEIGRRCAFGEGRLAFHTPRSEEIVESIRRAPASRHETLEGRRNSYKTISQRHSSSSSFESDHEKRKESAQSEDGMCTVHVSGTHRIVGDKISNQSLYGNAVQKRHHVLRKQQEICGDVSGEDANDVFDAPHDFTNDDKLSIRTSGPGRERIRSSDSSEPSAHRVALASTSTRGSDSESLDEAWKSTHKNSGDMGLYFTTSNFEMGSKPNSRQCDRDDDLSQSVDLDGDSQSYLELLSENPSSPVESEAVVALDDDDELLSKVVGDLTNPQRHRDNFINFKSASTGGIENMDKIDKDQGRRASAPCTSGQKIGKLSFSEDLSPPPVTPTDDKHAKHINLVAKRITKLEDIEEVASFDNESNNAEKDEPPILERRARSLSDTQPKKHVTLKENGRSATCDASIITYPSTGDDSTSSSGDHTTSLPTSPYKKGRESHPKSFDIRVNGNPLSKDPLSQLMFPKTKTPSFPKTLFRPTRSLGLEPVPRDRNRSVVPPPIVKREPPFERPTSPVGSDQGRESAKIPDDNAEQAPEVPPKTRSSSSLHSSIDRPNIPKRAPLREKSLSKDSVDSAPAQTDVRPYVNTPPPLTPRRPDAVPLTPMKLSKSSECLAPPPRPPKPSGLNPLEPTRSLPPYASGSEIIKKTGDPGRCISPLAFDTSFHIVPPSPRLRTSPDGEHHLRSGGATVKWRVASTTPPRSPNIERINKV